MSKKASNPGSPPQENKSPAPPAPPAPQGPSLRELSLELALHQEIVRRANLEMQLAGQRMAQIKAELARQAGEKDKCPTAA